MIERTYAPPEDVEKELRLLNAIVFDRNNLHNIIPFLRPCHFYNEQHAKIYDVILFLFDQGSPVDILLIINELRKRNQLEEIGAPYISALGDYISIDARTVFIYANQLIELWIKRESIKISMDIQEKAEDPTEDVFDMLEYALANFEELDVRSLLKESFINQVDKAIDNIVCVAEGKEEPFFDLGIRELSELLKLTMRRIFIFGAAGKVGKSKLTVWLITILCQKYDMAIDWHSYEMDEPALIRQLICCITGLTEDQIQGIKYILTEEDLATIERARDLIKGWKIVFTCTSQTVEGIASAHSLFVKKYQESKTMLVIDNLGGVNDSFPHKSKEENSEHISKQFQQIRDKTNSLIIIVHHLTKEVKSDPDAFLNAYRPKVEYVRGSTRVTDFANTVILLNSFSTYDDIRDEQRTAAEEYTTAKGHIIDELFIVENAYTRHGKTGIVRLICNLDNNYFAKWIPEERILKVEDSITFATDINEQWKQIWKLHEIYVKGGDDKSGKLALHDVIGKGKDGLEVDGIIVDFSFLYKRYKAYKASIVDKNSHYEKRYHTTVITIEEWLKRGMYKQNVDDMAMEDPKKVYLYGQKKNKVS